MVPKNPLIVSMLLSISTMSIAFINVISNGIMVVQSRKDQHFGSQDLITLFYISFGSGGVIGCTIGGLIT